MLTIQDIRQLGDRDIQDEIVKTRDLLFRQRMGTRTGHLRDTHKIKQLKSFIARLLTVVTQRQATGEKVAESDKAVTKKLADAHTEAEKHATAGKKKIDKEARLAHTAQHDEQVKKEMDEEDLAAKSDDKVKVKKAPAKKGVLGGLLKKRDA